MASFMFNAAKSALLRGTLDLSTMVASVTPLELTPLTTAATYGDIAGKATTGGGGSLVRSLADVGGDAANRIIAVPAEGKVKVQYAPVDYTALGTDNSAPIVGWVIAGAAAPVAGTLPVFFVENVDRNGAIAPFTPDGIEDLTLDLQTYPIGVGQVSNGFTDDYLLSRLKGDVAALPTVSLVLLESAVNLTTHNTFADLAAITAKTPGGDPIYVELQEFGSDINNRVIQVGDNYFWRFENPRFTDLETLSGNPVSHYALIADGGTLTGTEAVIGGNVLNPAFTPNGLKSFIVRVSQGIAVGV